MQYKGSSESHQINNLKVIIDFAKLLGSEPIKLHRNTIMIYETTIDQPIIILLHLIELASMVSTE
jgi:hypothetical protein